MMGLSVLMIPTDGDYGGMDITCERETTFTK
ncbi:hypothetical protein RUM4293_01654 [Ruegeria atlantica]|uniref:Uncharacterized protein n=1 Tax=Ruegeria atlantica TaxID=81569 RepID=A0A0P1EN88_9RHOB|nr:hypothetical protein RUM4293_01654 [Ruegeria atlantica]